MGKTISTKPLPSHERINSYLFVAETGLGKTYKAEQILQKELSHIDENNRFLVCPTFNFDKTLGTYFKNEDLVFDKLNDEFIPAILKLIEKDREEVYDKHHFKYDKNYIKIKIPRAKNTEPYNEFVLMLDDCIQYLGGKKQSFNNLTTLFTKNRHYGLHLLISAQYYKAAHPAIRTNCRQLFLWNTNLAESKKICDEQCQMRNKQDFLDYFRFITKPEYSSFHIDNKKRGINKYDNDISFKEFTILRDAGEIYSDSESD